MKSLVTILIVSAGLMGCRAEHWYSSDTAELELDIDAVAAVDARVVTPPGAWPDKELYGDALRLSADGYQVDFVGEVVDGRVTDERRDIDDHWGDNVNVLDAWRDCEVGARCDRTFRVAVSCDVDDGPCDALVEADAFLSVHLEPTQARRRGDPLRLSLEAVDRQGGRPD